MTLTLKAKPSIILPASLRSGAMTTYLDLGKAYGYFNKTLFAGQLPPCLITLQRHAGAKGYYSFGRFQSTINKTDTPDEIALNPQHFASRKPVEVLSTLAHEMAHCWQFHKGLCAPKRAYHNQEWADKMEEIGLMPSDTAAKGGKRTGQRVSHYIIPGGKYEKAFNAYAVSNATALYQDRALPADKAANAKKAASKSKFTCPNCECNAWGKETLMLVCGECEEKMEIAS